jgi:hypothetical protein
MSVIGFDLHSAKACEPKAGDGADYFLRLYTLSSLRLVTPSSQAQLVSDKVQSYDADSLLHHLSSLFRKPDTGTSNLAMAAWYRSCNHPSVDGRSWRRLERMAVQVFVHPHANIFAVQPVSNPRSDSADLARFIGVSRDGETIPGLDFRASVYPTIASEQASSPVAAVLEIPMACTVAPGFVALRGIEEQIDIQRLMS